MTRRMGIVGGLSVVLAAGLLSCSDAGEPPTQTGPPAGGGLTAAPASVTVAQGQARVVVISGGIQPYVIAEAPDGSLATAAITSDTLTITGVTVASVSGSTSVKVKDSSTPPEKEVRVPITKVP